MARVDAPVRHELLEDGAVLALGGAAGGVVDVDRGAPAAHLGEEEGGRATQGEARPEVFVPLGFAVDDNVGAEFHHVDIAGDETLANVGEGGFRGDEIGGHVGEGEPVGFIGGGAAGDVAGEGGEPTLLGLLLLGFGGEGAEDGTAGIADVEQGGVEAEAGGEPGVVLGAHAVGRDHALVEVDVCAVELGGVGLEGHVEDGVVLRAAGHEGLVRGEVADEDGVAIDDFLTEEGALGVGGELEFLEGAIVGDAADHEGAVMFDALGAEGGVLEWDAAEGFDGVDP